MFLSKLQYQEFEDSDSLWELKEFQLNKINLIVGNNASGKSRTLNVIFGLAKLLLSSKVQIISGSYNCCFIEDTEEITFEVQFKNSIVIFEKMTKAGAILYTRDKDGVGEILNMNINQRIKFKIPHNELVASRRDEIQYPYLEYLFNWASETRHFRFSKEQEKHTLAIIDSNKPFTDDFKLNEGNQAIKVFKLAKGKYREQFTDNLIKDFNKIGYDISDVDTGILHSIKVDGPMGNKLVGLRLFENDRAGFTDQNEMSDGMFRALSILIHYNFYILENRSLNVLIDDIGEGLDYEKSSNLIMLLIEKTTKSKIQLIMSTNDKFVMNNTNLDYWQVITRVGGIVSMHNKSNSVNIFDEFKYTGLNNFDFFSTEFFKTGLN